MLFLQPRKYPWRLRCNLEIHKLLINKFKKYDLRTIRFGTVREEAHIPGNEKLPDPDGRVVITLNEVNYIRFSLGKQELINQSDLNDLRARLLASAESANN